jgi:hypothetical protein
MQKTIAGNTYDPEVDEEITNYDGGSEELVLYRTATGLYYFEVEKYQTFIDGSWSDFTWNYDNEDDVWDELPKERKRSFVLIRPLSAEQAIDWYLATIVPYCLREMLVRK